METESPAFIPTTFNPVSTSYISTPSPPPITARLYSRPPVIAQRQKPLPPLPPPPSQSQPQPPPPPPKSTSKQFPTHQSRASVDSLYDLLADLDETQLSYLVQELNHTTSQNLAVSQAISAFETSDPSPSLSAARSNMQLPTMHRQPSKSQKVRLSLQTMFRQNSIRQSHRRREPNPQEEVDILETSTPTTSRRKSPAYKRISRPTFNLPPGVTITDLLNLLEAEFLHAASSATSHSLTPSSSLSPLSTSLSPSSSFSCSSASPSTPQGPPTDRRIRRYPSTLDMELEAERSAQGIEGIGLGMLEPRPTTPACGSGTPISARGSPSTPLCGAGERRFMRGDTPPTPSRAVAPPLVLDGIFEVLESK